MYKSKANVGDLINSATDGLLFYIGARERHFADMQFDFILDVLKSNGSLGKQIRYVQRELGKFTRTATESGCPHIAREASLYASRLPKPADVDGKVNNGGLALISGLENAAIQAELDRARAQSIMEMQ